MNLTPLNERPNTQAFVADGNIFVSLHGHLIVKAHERFMDGKKLVCLNTHGYNTNITRDRMNLALNLLGVPAIVSKYRGKFLVDTKLPILYNSPLGEVVLTISEEA